MNHILQNLNVMITRPNPSGKILCDMIEKAGGHPISFPTIDIAPLTDSADFIQSISCLNTFDWLIFISPQAAHQTTHHIHTQWTSFPSHVKIAAIGKGTAAALREANLPVTVYPDDSWNSEALLMLPSFQVIKDQKIGLIRGEGGRSVITETLKRRGANVIQIIAYKRCLPTTDIFPYLDLLNNKKIDIIVSTSNEILQNLVNLLDTKGNSILHTIPLLVISKRMLEFAKYLGFKTIILANNASHDAIIERLKDFICQMKPKKKQLLPK